jgi:23S rRNA (pseudouridine1915-N3)-methyltransferase
MKLAVVAVGRLKSGPERDLVERYRERAEALGPRARLSRSTSSRSPRAAAGARRSGAPRRAASWRKSSAGASCALDERGQTSPATLFAARSALARRGAAGAVAGHRRPGRARSGDRARADLVLSFGALTLPHQLVRVLAMEQLYRALTILAGPPLSPGRRARW